jgi:large subunit ribosomal protein L21
MFAVLKTGGKQYRVQNGDVLRIEKLDASAGDTVTFDQILMLGGDSPVIGTPIVAGASVSAEVLAQAKADKVISYVKRRRKHSSQRTRGHRQSLTVVRVTDILADGKSTGPAKARVKAEAAAEPVGARPSNLLEAPRDGGADDLSRISGVGPKLVGLLNDNGVFHFDQIAAWSEAEVAYMDEQLSFKGRIGRDNWIEQAATLAAEKE